VTDDEINDAIDALEDLLADPHEAWEWVGIQGNHMIMHHASGVALRTDNGLASVYMVSGTYMCIPQERLQGLREAIQETVTRLPDPPQSLNPAQEILLAVREGKKSKLL